MYCRLYRPFVALIQEMQVFLFLLQLSIQKEKRRRRMRKIIRSVINYSSTVGFGFCLALFRPISKTRCYDVISLPCAYRKQARVIVYKSRTDPKFTHKRLSNLLTTQRNFSSTQLPNNTNENMKELALNANASANANNVNNLNSLKRLSISNHDEDDIYINEEPDFGIMFDIDGVLARGTNPLQAAIDAFKVLTDDEGQLRVPVAFVTNACNRSTDKAAQIQGWLGIEVTPDMVVHSPTPLMIMEEYHNKHILLVGQGPVRDVAKELGFKNYCLLDDVCDAYPLLDMVNHENRKAVAQGYIEKEFPKVEAIILLGEPVKWESNLQVLTDLLLTSGKPDHSLNTQATIEQIPVIACNMDLTFMHKATMPRFGHGAFLVCLEALYKKITGTELKYTKLVGKPCEIQFRYGEHILNKVRDKMGWTTPLRKLYFVGDNPNVDVMGANMYNMYLKAKHSRRQSQAANLRLPSSRALPSSDMLTEQTATVMYSLLVGTGVFNPNSPNADEIINTTTTTTTTTTSTTNANLNTTTANPTTPYHGHRDIENRPALTKPTKYCPDVCHAVKFMLEQEGFIC